MAYRRNLQGDIIGIVDNSGNVVVRYGYDAWGNPVHVRTLTTAYEALAGLNPFRYRGYVWDQETGLYYLRSRYYAPVWGRFLSVDPFLGTTCGVLSHAVYTYCNNKPISGIDHSGHSAKNALIILYLFLLVRFKDSYKEKPTSDVGAAKPYRKMSGSTTYEDPEITNCYAYSLGITGWFNPGSIAGMEVDFSDVYSIGMGVMVDAAEQGYTIRIVSGPDAKVYDDEWKIALRSGTTLVPGSNSYDYHFMVQTSTGQWAEKHGPGGDSILWEEGETPDTIPWTLAGKDYYDSEIIYFAIGGS